MTLLLMETRRLNEEFDELWLGWQAQNGVAEPLTPAAQTLVHNHFALALYEFFPELPLRVARDVARAARALGYVTLLGEQQPLGGAWTSAARSFLRAQVLDCWQRAGAREEALLEACLVEHQTALAGERHAQAESPGAPYPTDAWLAASRAKCAPARATATVLARLAGAGELLPALHESQHHLYLGLRLSREVTNWKQDYVAGVCSYTLARLAAAARATPARDAAQRQADLQEMGRHFYYSGLAESLLSLASEHFCRAMAASTELPPSGWGGMASAMRERNEELRADISRIREQRLARLGATSDAGAPAFVAHQTQPNVAQAVAQAARYLAGEQLASGAWGDFLLLGEQCTFKVTGYVGWTLARLDDQPADLARATRWLLERRSTGQAWGFNGHWPRDADATAHVLLFLATRPDAPRTSWHGALDALSAHQAIDGGFAALFETDAWLDRLRLDVDAPRAWTASQACATAVIGLLLAGLAGAGQAEQAVRAASFLRATQQDDGCWESPWWLSHSYVSARAVQALRAVGASQDAPELRAARAGLLRAQGADGGWSAARGSRSEAFSTAMALQGLCALTPDGTLDVAIARGLEWLTERQLDDGSWPESPILRIPQPGAERVLTDWHRVFTTATAIQALHCCVQERARRAADARSAHAARQGVPAQGERFP